MLSRLHPPQQAAVRAPVGVPVAPVLPNPFMRPLFVAPQPRDPQQQRAERHPRGFWAPDFSEYRNCYVLQPTGKTLEDGRPEKVVVQVDCPPKPEPPKKKGWCTIL